MTMPEPAEDLIVRNLIEALERLREDLDRMELWAAALGSFQHPVPDYRPERPASAASRKPRRAEIGNRSIAAGWPLPMS